MNLNNMKHVTDTAVVAVLQVLQELSEQSTTKLPNFTEIVTRCMDSATDAMNAQRLSMRRKRTLARKVYLEVGARVEREMSKPVLRFDRGSSSTRSQLVRAWV